VRFSGRQLPRGEAGRNGNHLDGAVRTIFAGYEFILFSHF